MLEPCIRKLMATSPQTLHKNQAWVTGLLISIEAAAGERIAKLLVRKQNSILVEIRQKSSNVTFSGAKGCVEKVFVC